MEKELAGGDKREGEKRRVGSEGKESEKQASVLLTGTFCGIKEACEWMPEMLWLIHYCLLSNEKFILHLTLIIILHALTWAVGIIYQGFCLSKGIFLGDLFILICKV